MSTPQWFCLHFDALNPVQLYQLLQLRADVFVIEQQCIYPDIDGKDFKALHLLGYEGDVLVAYARLFESGDYFENASIGRVLTRLTHRNTGLGHELMKRAIQAIHAHWGEQTIEISAQAHLEAFYNQHGFVAQGNPYLEDDIPHIRMFRK